MAGSAEMLSSLRRVLATRPSDANREFPATFTSLLITNVTSGNPTSRWKPLAPWAVCLGNETRLRDVIHRKNATAVPIGTEFRRLIFPSFNLALGYGTRAKSARG